MIAPDHVGFGRSADALDRDEFDYTFDALAQVTEGLLDQLGVERYAIYVQDYGAPIGWRLALRRPERDHRDHHPERQRLRRGLRRPILGARSWAYAARPEPGHEAGSASR